MVDNYLCMLYLQIPCSKVNISSSSKKRKKSCFAEPVGQMLFHYSKDLRFSNYEIPDLHYDYSPLRKAQLIILMIINLA